MKQRVAFYNVGEVDYKVCWDMQEAVLSSLVARKMAIREQQPENAEPPVHTLIFCEHPHVFTLGKSGHEDHLLADESLLRRSEAVFYKINRGGDITYHGPGQIVGYPIFDLDYFFNDIHKYLRYLEEAVIRTCADYSLTAGRIEGLTGVWLDIEKGHGARKICAFGVRCSRWVTMHGFAFNVNTDLSYFNLIVPCGITDKGVTSLKQELGREVDMDEVREKLLGHLQDLFTFEWTAAEGALLPWPDRINS